MDRHDWFDIHLATVIAVGRKSLREILSDSEIALSTGFSDQSHFAKHFRRLTGMTPSAARWNQR